MAGRTKYTAIRIESEIEKNRVEGNWAKVIDLATQLKEKTTEGEYLSDFLIGEGMLESYLEEWPPLDANINRAKMGLMDAKKYLQTAANDMGKKAGVALDAYLLLGKLHYACGAYSESLKSFNLAELHILPEKKLPLRSLRIVAESYAIRGLCMQRESKTSKFKSNNKDDDLYKSLCLASDLTLLYMQEYDKQSYTNTNTGTQSPQPPPVNKNFSPVLEQALIAAPAMYIQNNNMVEALERYRTTLTAVESQTINTVRLKLMCQFAEFLLYGSINDNYKQPQNGSYNQTSPWKPKQYTSVNQFVPRVNCEETILLLLVAEAIAVRNAVLSQSPEFKEARLSAYQDASAVYDLLALATIRWGQVSLLQESLERSIKFSFRESHLWRQHALSLISMGRYEHALGVLKEVIKLETKTSVNCLLAAKLCYEHLDRPLEGIEFSNQAKDIELRHPSGLLARCHLYMGIGYHLQARKILSKVDKEEINDLALENFQAAEQLEPQDHLCKYYLGLHLALTENVTEALAVVKTALYLQPDNSSTIHLLTLLLSACAQHDEALQLISVAVNEFPDNLNLMYVKSHLELHQEGGEKALITARQMLEMWKNLYEGHNNGSDAPECDRKSDTRSVFQLYTSEMSDKDSSSLQAHSIAASRVEQALSEVASSVSSFNPRPGPQRAYMLLLEVWLLLADLYLAIGQTADVLKSIQEASQIFPLSHHILHMRGLLHMHKHEWGEAKLCFQNAVAINPQHVKSLQQLGLVYHYLGLQGLAETTLREAAKIDPSNHVTWYNLGKVLESLGEFETASFSMATALTVETRSPILPFTLVPLCFE